MSAFFFCMLLALGKDAEAANVFGFVSDAENNSALAVNPDGDTRTVIASIDTPVPHGKRPISA